MGAARARTGTAGAYWAPGPDEPSDPHALLRFAELAVKAGHAGVACETYARASEAFAREGLARRAIGSLGQALTIARVEAFVDRVLPFARMLGKLYLAENLVRDAASTLDSAAGWLIERGFDADALPLLEDRLDIEDSEIARLRLADVHVRLRTPGEAAEQLALAFRSLHARGRRDEALEVAERLLRQRPDVEVARASAELYLARNRDGDPLLALAKLRLCCDADPSHGPTLALLARALDVAGHTENAARVRREIASASQRGGDGSRAASSRPSAFPTRPTAPPRRHSAIRPKVLAPEEDQAATTEDSIECFWEELVSENDSVPDDPPHSWLPDAEPLPDEDGGVIFVGLGDVELVDSAPASRAGARAESRLETALESIESLVARGRYEEAALLVVRQLTVRPRSPLLLERKAEIEALLDAQSDKSLAAGE